MHSRRNGVSSRRPRVSRQRHIRVHRRQMVLTPRASDVRRRRKPFRCRTSRVVREQSRVSRATDDVTSRQSLLTALQRRVTALQFGVTALQFDVTALQIDLTMRRWVGSYRSMRLSPAQKTRRRRQSAPTAEHRGLLTRIRQRCNRRFRKSAFAFPTIPVAARRFFAREIFCRAFASDHDTINRCSFERFFICLQTIGEAPRGVYGGTDAAF